MDQISVSIGNVRQGIGKQVEKIKQKSPLKTAGF